MDDENPNPIHGLFGLSYAQWLILPRVVLQEMPQEWQARFVGLLDELYERFNWDSDEFSIRARAIGKDGRMVSMPERLENYRHPDRRWLNSIDSTKGAQTVETVSTPALPPEIIRQDRV
jgi:hypothetical protein